MRGQKKQIKATVLIVNYNNQKYLDRCIKSVINQTYKNLEIIFVDDLSTDKSFKLAKKYKQIKALKTKKKTKFGSLNQINSYKTGIKKSTGDVIFFLDSDDFFKKRKVEITMKYFKKKKLDICFDKPIIFFNNKKKIKQQIKSRSKFLIPWPKFGPQSCISINKKYLLKIWKNISIKKFENIWLDFRIINQAFIENKNIFVVPGHLTYYQQNKYSISSKFKKFSSNWWIRRAEAHKFVKYLYKKNKTPVYISADEILTNIINKIIK